MTVMNLSTIGIIHSPWQEATGTPVQSSLASGVEGAIEVFPEYSAGLQDLNGFERIWLVFFRPGKTDAVVITPYLDTKPRGLFATRAPSRPNSVGFSAVRLLGIKGNILRVEGLDVLDKTPLLDIKPYIPAFDVFEVKRIGWCADVQGNGTAADGRFENGGLG
jgi:tRNA-Thr(GGU) m(6)t(6)A37 methyltransferase TsaA